MSDSLGIVRREQNCITKCLYDHQFILDLIVFSKRRTTDKVVLYSLRCSVESALLWTASVKKESVAEILVGCMEGVRSAAISASAQHFGW